MSDMKTRTLGRKNVKGLALSAPPVKHPAPSAGDAQIPGAIGNSVTRTDTLEIGVEFKLDLRNEDLIVLKELGAGNGGTVSKVMHAATKVIMAKKVIVRDRCRRSYKLTSIQGDSCGSEEGCTKANRSRTPHHA
jgi:mitogen-activated protein kinase kinase